MRRHDVPNHRQPQTHTRLIGTDAEQEPELVRRDPGAIVLNLGWFESIGTSSDGSMLAFSVKCAA